MGSGTTNEQGSLMSTLRECMHSHFAQFVLISIVKFETSYMTAPIVHCAIVITTQSENHHVECGCACGCDSW